MDGAITFLVGVLIICYLFKIGFGWVSLAWFLAVFTEATGDTVAPLVWVALVIWTIVKVVKRIQEAAARKVQEEEHLQRGSSINGVLAVLAVVAVGCISIFISAIADFSVNQMLLCLAISVSAPIIFLLYKANITKNRREQQENAIKTLNLLYSSILSSYEIVMHTSSITQFFDEFEKIEQKSEEIKDIGAKVEGGEAFIEKIDSIKILPTTEDYQWMLRNTIERQARIALKNIKTTYKNSATYKQGEYNNFRRDVSAHQDLYNGETASFVNSLIDELDYAVTGERRASQAVSPDVARERSLMSASLRYDIMKRDGFKCTICGRSQADGVKLHVDHILPVSKGGKTTPSNLRTLCQDCNLGKSDKYDDSGEN